MTSVRTPSRLTRAAAAAVALAASAGALPAQSSRTLFAWSGRVDREVLLVMRRGGVETRFSGGSDEDRGRLRVNDPLPRTDGYVDVRLTRGRGSADVVQQPSANNDYTAILRLRDDQAGTGDYQIAALWRPTGGSYDGGYDRNDRNGRGNNGRGYGWGRGGRDDRNRDDRNRDDRNRGDRDRGDRDRDNRRGDDDYGYGRDDRNTGRGPGSIWDRATGRTGSTTASGVLRWSGRVDEVQEVRIRGRRASTYTVSGGGASDVRTSVSGSGLPARSGTVRIRTFDGRGSVRVVEQPSARNDYTAVLRVEDRQGGAGFYDFEASWY